MFAHVRKFGQYWPENRFDTHGSWVKKWGFQHYDPFIVLPNQDPKLLTVLILKAIFNKYGYPNYDLVGKKGANNYWLCVQHCDHDLKFQQQVLTGMEKDVKANKADGKNYAYLTDRVNINSGKPQLYGTQVDWKDDSAVAKELKDPETVNQRRASVGLGTLEEYLAMMNKMHKEMNANR